MPTDAAHKETIIRNKSFQQDIKNGSLSDNYCEWQIVFLFYAAVHTIDLTLHASGYTDASDHEDRHTMLVQETGNGGYSADIIGFYNDLYTASRLARYKCKRFTQDEVNIAKKVLDKLETLTYFERKKVRRNN